MIPLRFLATVAIGLVLMASPLGATCFVRSRAVVVSKPVVVAKAVVAVAPVIPVAIYAPIPVFGAVYTPPVAVPAAPVAPTPGPTVTAPRPALAASDEALQTIITELRSLKARIDSVEKKLGPTVTAPGKMPPAAEEKPEDKKAAKPTEHPGVGAMRAKCASCHEATVANKKGGNFVMFTGASLATLQPKQILRVATQAYSGRMPPKASGVVLNDEEVAQIMAWADQK